MVNYLLNDDNGCSTGSRQSSELHSITIYLPLTI